MCGTTDERDMLGEGESNESGGGIDGGAAATVEGDCIADEECSNKLA
jgi:hypothetical protein